MEKIKAGIYISKEARENMNRLKEFNVRPNDFLDLIFSFNKKALTQYIDLISKYQDKEQWKVVNEKFVCTTMKDEIQKYNKLVLDKFTTNELNTIVLDKKTAELPNNKKEFHHNKSQSQSQSQEKAISSLLENNLKLTTAIEYLIEDNRKHEKEIALLKKKVEELKK